MNKKIENNFVNKFIKKSKRERVLFELNANNKRSHIIQKIIEFLDTDYIVYDREKVSDEEVFTKISEYADISMQCYVMGDTSDDGKVLPFKDAFNHMMNGGGVYIIISADGNTAIIKEEVCFTPCKLILHRE